MQRLVNLSDAKDQMKASSDAPQPLAPGALGMPVDCTYLLLVALLRMRWCAA